MTNLIYLKRDKIKLIKMPQYIVLINFTDQGIKTIRDIPKRLTTSKALVEKAGGKW